MKSVFALGAIAAAVLLGAASSAHAVPTLSFSIDNGATWTVVADGGAGDNQAAPHVVGFSGALGSFDVNATTGTGNFFSPANMMDLLSLNASALGAGSMMVRFSDTGFTEFGTLNGAWGGVVTNNGRMSVTGAVYAGTTNLLNEQSVLLGSLGPMTGGAFSASFNNVAPLSGPYSLTQIITITTTGAASYSGNFEMTVPEPGTLALAGAALLGLGALRRRRTA